VAVDIGSVGPSPKFAWAAFDAPGRDLIAAGADPETAVSALAPGLLSGARAALLLEAPMSVPVPDGQSDAWRTLGEGAERRRQQAMVGGSRRRRTGDRTGAGCMDAAPACRHGPGTGSDDTARVRCAVPRPGAQRITEATDSLLVDGGTAIPSFRTDLVRRIWLVDLCVLARTGAGGRHLSAACAGRPLQASAIPERWTKQDGSRCA
jgi:hypothetical protein